MTTYQEQSKIIGKEAMIETNGLRLKVLVKDHKQSYGKDRWLVTPVAGSGNIWVERLSVLNNQNDQSTQENHSLL